MKASSTLLAFVGFSPVWILWCSVSDEPSKGLAALVAGVGLLSRVEDVLR